MVEKTYLKIPALEERHLVTDDRELLRLRSLIAKYIENYKQVRMQIGDFRIFESCFERKTLDDFLSSSYGRLFDQVKNLVNAYEDPWLILEGTWPTKKYDRKQLLVRLTAYAQGFPKLRIMWCTDVDATAQFLVLFYKRFEKKRRESTKKLYLPKRLPIGDTPKEITLIMLGAIPTIGATAAHAIIQRANIDTLCQMDVDEISIIEIKDRKLGLKRAQRIYDVLHY